MTVEAPPMSAPTPPPAARRADIAFGGLAVLVLLGLVARVWPREALWLDEAQSVAIASEALTAIPDVLRTDGAPPAYYVLLHVWMELFGESDIAVRSLSIVLSIATLVVAGLALRRVLGDRVTTAVVVLLATNPFVVRYATEGRMYALVMLEVLLGVVAVDACLRRPTIGRAGAVSAITALLLYTHYWSIYLVAAVGVVLAVAARRPGSARPALGAVVVGVALWLPWVPTFLFQSERTATPWAESAQLTSVLAVFDPGGRRTLHLVLSGVMVGLVALALWRGRRLVRRPLSVVALAAVMIGTLTLALAGAMLSDSAYSSRYTSVAVPLMILLAAVGVVSLGPRWSVPVLVVVGVVGLVLSGVEVATARTRSSAFVDPLRKLAQPGDVLVYCPDQLGPAASRLLTQDGVELRQVVFPPSRPPDRVDWIDYADRHRDAAPIQAAVALDAEAGSAAIWMVFSGTYPPTQRACRGLFNSLSLVRADELIVDDDPSLSDHGALWRFTP